VGERWTLLIIRDLMFEETKTPGEFIGKMIAAYPSYAYQTTLFVGAASQALEEA